MSQMSPCLLFHIDYVDYMLMPKFVVVACGDEFFLPDESHFFWDALKGPKYLR